jgi:hypothetical protein
MYTVSIEGRVPLALAEDGDVRTIIPTDLDMDLSTFAIIFCLSPNFTSGCKMLQRVNASAAFNRFWDLLIARNGV